MGAQSAHILIQIFQIAKPNPKRFNLYFLLKIMDVGKISVKLVWVPGHSGFDENEAAELWLEVPRKMLGSDPNQLLVILSPKLRKR